MRSLSTLSQRRIFEQTFYGFRGSVQKSAYKKNSNRTPTQSGSDHGVYKDSAKIP